LTDLLVSIGRTNFYAGDVGAGLGSLSSRVWCEYASLRKLEVGYELWMVEGVTAGATKIIVALSTLCNVTWKVQ
jgi:hypothetical protein